MALVDVLNTESKLTKVCFNMEQYGVKIDQDYTRREMYKENNELIERKDLFKKDTGRTYKDSPKLFKEIFDERHESYPLTEKGNPSFKSAVLEKMGSSTAAQINKIRYYDKRISTYYKNFLEMQDARGVLHPSMNQAGTTTGRFSYSNPNLQNVPKQDGIRNCFVAREQFFDFDYRAVEYRLLADYANEKYLIEAINDGADVHQATADLLKISRKQAKTVNFGILYGCGNKTLAEMLNLDIEEAKYIRQEYYNKLPQIRKFTQAVADTGGGRGYVRNWAGRICRIKTRSEAYKLVNYLIQSSAADVIKKAMVDINCPYMCLQVHDSLMFDAEDIDTQRVKDKMISAYKPFFGIKLDVSLETGKRWGSLTEI